MSRLFVAVALCCIAFVAATQAVDETVFSADNEIETVEFIEQTVHAKAKLSSVDRHAIRHSLREAFFDANLDDSYLQTNELLETKEEGSGYGEMTEIMKKVDELEKKINDKLAEDLKYIKEKNAYCAKTKSQLEGELAALANKIAKHNANISAQGAAIVASTSSIIAGKGRVGEWNKKIDDYTRLRQIDVDAYKTRMAKRLKEINVLQICNDLVCTEFTDFKDTQVCKDIKTYGVKIQEYAGQATGEKLDDLLKRAGDLGADYEKKLKAQQEMDKINTDTAAAITAQATATATPTPTKKKTNEAELKVTALVEILQNSDLPEAIFKPARRIISMIRTGEAAAKAVYDPATAPTDADLKDMNLPESLVALLRRITNDQKRETLDYISLLDKYHNQIKEANDAVAAEVARQTVQMNNINNANQSINDSKDSNIKSSQVVTATQSALATLVANCRKEQEDYDKRTESRKGELVNVEKLRSLLRTLQNSDLPKCPSDCTNTNQGKCIWKGLMGADSYCACTKGFWGAACEKRMCPGPNGVLYTSAQQDVCSRRGTCNEAADKGTCTCAASYYHGPNNACEFKVCPGNGNCNGRGTCDNVTGLCTCYTKYYGVECQRMKCEASPGVLVEATNSAVCSGRGACNTNTSACQCGGGYSGSVCQYILCPNNCNGRGACNLNNGTCNCNAGFFGRQCENVSCPENCNGGNGSCNYSNGRCACNDGASGPSCRPVNAADHRAVYAGDNWANNRWTWDWNMCPDQFLMYGVYRGDWNENLRSLNHIYCLRPKEGGYYVGYNTCFEQDVRSQWAWRGANRMAIHWATCPSGYFMRGMLRSTAGASESTIDNLERFYCCRISDNEAVASVACQSNNWWGCLDRPGACTVAGWGIMVGMGRTQTNNKVWNIEEAWSCYWKRTASTRQLP